MRCSPGTLAEELLSRDEQAESCKNESEQASRDMSKYMVLSQ